MKHFSLPLTRLITCNTLFRVLLLWVLFRLNVCLGEEWFYGTWYFDRDVTSNQIFRARANVSIPESDKKYLSQYYHTPGAFKEVDGEIYEFSSTNVAFTQNQKVFNSSYTILSRPSANEVILKYANGIKADFRLTNGLLETKPNHGMFFYLCYSRKPTQSISNGSGNIRAGDDINIQSSNSAKVIKDYENQFETMTAKRRDAGIVCLEFLSKTNWDLVTNNTDSLVDVLSFFNLLGNDLERHRVSTNDVFYYFCDDILSYYQTSKGYIDKIQTNDSTELVHLKSLYDAMRIEAASPGTTVAEIYFHPQALVIYFKGETNSANLPR